MYSTFVNHIGAIIIDKIKFIQILSYIGFTLHDDVSSKSFIDFSPGEIYHTDRRK